jgi:hypothetical protein
MIDSGNQPNHAKSCIFLKCIWDNRLWQQRIDMWAYMLWSTRRNPTRHLEPQEHLKELYKVPEGSSDRPVRTNQVTINYAPAWGVSTRLLSYLFDELRGEYEKFLIHLPIGQPVLRMYVGSPLSKGVSGGDENARQHYVLRRTYKRRKLSARTLIEWGVLGDPTRVVLLQLHLAIWVPTHGYLSIQQCTSSNGEKGSKNEKASHQYTYHWCNSYELGLLLQGYRS